MSEIQDYILPELLPKNNNRPLDTILKGEFVMAEAIYKIRSKYSNVQVTEEFLLDELKRRAK
jgi:hypothetical protein